jgi:hypothetical protein
VTFNEVVTLISIALTVPFLWYCILIFIEWWPAFRYSFTKKVLEPHDFLSRGILVGFSANFLDNLYWGVAWALVLVDESLGMPMVLVGSLSNIFFRQIGGIYAAKNHVIAAKTVASQGYSTSK